MTPYFLRWATHPCCMTMHWHGPNITSQRRLMSRAGSQAGPPLPTWSMGCSPNALACVVTHCRAKSVSSVPGCLPAAQ